MHRDPAVWGADAALFKPERWQEWQEGAGSGGCMALLAGLGPNGSYLPFGGGPRYGAVALRLRGRGSVILGALSACAIQRGFVHVFSLQPNPARSQELHRHLLCHPGGCAGAGHGAANVPLGPPHAWRPVPHPKAPHHAAPRVCAPTHQAAVMTWTLLCGGGGNSERRSPARRCWIYQIPNNTARSS